MLRGEALMTDLTKKKLLERIRLSAFAKDKTCQLDLPKNAAFEEIQASMKFK
jgi:hypothetical protein